MTKLLITTSQFQSFPKLREHFRVVCKQYGIDPRQYDIDKLMSEVRNIELGV